MTLTSGDAPNQHPWFRSTGSSSGPSVCTTWSEPDEHPANTASTSMAFLKDLQNLLVALAGLPDVQSRLGSTFKALWTCMGSGESVWMRDAEALLCEVLSRRKGSKRPQAQRAAGSTQCLASAGNSLPQTKDVPSAPPPVREHTTTLCRLTDPEHGITNISPSTAL
ncbi:hypothetical protein EYF80_015276 [Liparis tanakae]|uniref:Uncharacterized protein n=1 Tax=Liparis tanakae TaxID=230148 RepID=A0A4Z2I8Z4_9TELE|nr:hypothetical protein EYF80_015276 [Liparis tanakae]